MAPIALAANRADGVQAHVAESDLANWLGYAGEHFDPARDIVLAEIDGSLVGYAWVEWVDTTEGLREFRLGAYVHPDADGARHRSQPARLAGGARRLAAGGAAAGKPLAYGTWSPEERAAKRHLFERAGYEVARYFFEMRRTNLDEVDMPPMPEGLEIRPIGHDRASQKQLWDADAEAFRGDHWGGFDDSDANFERAMGDPDHDPDLYVIAWDGDEIAGGVTNSIWTADNEAFNRTARLAGDRVRASPVASPWAGGGARRALAGPPAGGGDGRGDARCRQRQPERRARPLRAGRIRVHTRSFASRRRFEVAS